MMHVTSHRACSLQIGLANCCIHAMRFLMLRNARLDGVPSGPENKTKKSKRNMK